MRSTPKRDERWILLSLVGLQPSATASAIKTWSGWKGRPARVVLLATQRTQQDGQARRLQAWCAAEGLAADIIPIADDLRPAQSPPAAPEAVQRLLAARDPAVVQDLLASRDPEAAQSLGEALASGARLVFCGDPGPKFMVVAVAQVLPPTTVVLHADNEHLYCLSGQSQVEKRPLSNLGLKALLDLYGLSAASDESQMSPVLSAMLETGMTLPRAVQKGLILCGQTHPVFLDLAWERGGRLYGVRGVAKSLEELRRYARLAEDLNRLRPELAIVSPGRSIREHAKAYGLAAFAPAEHLTLQGWISGVLPPGHVVASYTQGPIGPTVVRRGCGGSEPPLVVWLGADPSATLVALYTHQPRHALILYDASTPAVVERAGRLQQISDRLPVGKIVFVPSNRWGWGVREAVRTLLTEEMATGAEVRANITPGTKAQAVALSRIPGLDLWSLGRDGARSLADERRTLPLRGPDLAVQAWLEGGTILQSSQPQIRDKEKRFLCDLVLFLARWVEEKRQSGHEPVSLVPLPEELTCSAGSLRRIDGGVELRLANGRRWRRSLESSGAWLERAVAACLIEAGCDEVRLNVKWAWPPGTEPPPAKDHHHPFRDEADVVARLENRFFVFSCKAGKKKMTRLRLTKEIAAVAENCLGRLAVPVLVSPWFADAEVKASLREPVVCLNFASLEPGRLKATLCEAWMARSTLAQARAGGPD